MDEWIRENMEKAENKSKVEGTDQEEMIEGFDKLIQEAADEEEEVERGVFSGRIELDSPRSFSLLDEK